MADTRYPSLVTLVVLALACDGSPQVAEGGSETHFLSTCVSECGNGFVCRCGACTQECAGDAECSALAPNATCVPAAARVAEGRCSASEKVAVCDATCLKDDDCRAAGDDMRCDGGFCRDAASQPNDGAAPLTCNAADIAPSELVIIGDSLIQLSTFASDLEANAAASDELSSDAHYRSYASAAMSFLAENSFSISSQYAMSQQAGPARVIVMNGGATDMLQYPCRDALTPECPAVAAAVSGAERLFSRMASDGVEHVVYMFYPDPRADQALQAGLDVLRPLVRNACGASAVACHWIDLRPTFAGHDDYLGPDGIVFSTAGARAAASAVWQAMQARCVPR